MIYDFYKLTQQPCFFCISLKSGTHNTKPRKFPFKYMGVDRLDNNIDYLKSNCVPSCFICNRMKSDRQLREFINQVEKIYLYQKGEDLRGRKL